MKQQITLEDVAYRATVIARSRHLAGPHLEPLIDHILTRYADEWSAPGPDHLNDWLIRLIKDDQDLLRRRLRAAGSLTGP